MTMRRTATALASTVIAGLGVAMLAPSAHADSTVTFSGELSWDSGTSTWVGGAFTPSAVVGETVTLGVTATPADPTGSTDPFPEDDKFYIVSGGSLLLDGAGCTFKECAIFAGESRTFAIDLGAINASVILRDIDSNPVDGSFTVTYGASTDPQASTSSNPGPGPLIQQFARPAVGSCDAAQPAGLNWGGVPDGGWGESWSRGMNEGEGGHVCTRTLIYDPSAAGWMVQ